MAPPKLELYGAKSCPYTAELRERLEWDGRDFVEHDVEADSGAFTRLAGLTGGGSQVPVLVEDGRVVQVGWQGRSCVTQAPPAAAAPPAPAAAMAAADAGPAGAPGAPGRGGDP